MILFFGCAQNTVPKNETGASSGLNMQINSSLNTTANTNQKIPINANETPKTIEGKGMTGTAMEIKELVKKTISPYSDNYLFWIYGTSISNDGKNHENEWRVVLITPDVAPKMPSKVGGYISATSGIIYKDRSEFKVGEDPSIYVRELPRVYPLEGKFLDSDEIIKKAVKIMVEKLKKEKNITESINLISNKFNVNYFGGTVKVYTVDKLTNTPITICMNVVGNETASFFDHDVTVDCTSPY